MAQHFIPQELNGWNIADVRGRANLIEIHRKEFPDFKGSFLNGLVPYGNFGGNIPDTNVHPIFLVSPYQQYKGIAPQDLQPQISEPLPYEV